MCRQGGNHDAFGRFEQDHDDGDRHRGQRLRERRRRRHGGGAAEEAAMGPSEEDGLHSQVWRWMYQLTDEEVEKLPEEVWEYHRARSGGAGIGPNECCSVLIQRVRAPLPVVWSVVRRFDKPQLYKNFIRSCSFKGDELRVGCTREVTVVSGLPATSSTERLEILDDDKHVLSFRVVGGDHRLNNYRSVTSLHEFDVEGAKGTLVVESYVVDVPPGNTRQDTCLFTDTVVRCNLQSLAHMTEKLAVACASEQHRQLHQAR
ncbi:abscisic acid receptor PYL8 [Selaginella moellendorffii]|uniref:abscisic acid receptor PYL8 n=1 Tax=Selaginella moellendorffii TaxID=88036 RepID=UPI000D1C6C60|nr:abscisic acid receptor PYL8 [Selaginella moellendorffii]|eukprot:XP_002974589.2 abscisic acid receptor PYL8 [Selaginella moellendorffii]